LGTSIGRVNVDVLDLPEWIDEVAHAISVACSGAWVLRP
jgi:hypothetical protein